MDKNKETFKEKVFELLKSFRIWVLILFLVISYFSVNYNFGEEGIVINGIVPGSLASTSGMNFDSSLNPRDFEQVLVVNGNQINTVTSFYEVLEKVPRNNSFLIETNVEKYLIFVPENNLSVADQVGISVRESSKSNVRLGIELEGGSRLILKVVENLSDSDYSLLVDTLQSRLDVYGASGTKVNKLEDSFSDDKFVIVESISSNKNDIYELISRQGIFEAKIGNETVFTGENVVRVFNDPQNANLQGCTPSSGGTICSFAFSVEIDSVGATQFFEKTSSLDVIGGQLSEEVSFHLDSKEITSLSIASSFKYRKITKPQITVSGEVMPNENLAIKSAQEEMKFLQTILSTQSLPSELEVVQSYSISTDLGEELLSNSIIVGLFALLLVSLVVAIRYQTWVLFVGIFMALITEIIIVFGIAAFMRLSIDLAAIGGLIAAIGTGVDDQIIISDEYFRKREKSLSSRKKVKAAIAIIMVAYLTTLAAMVPLNFAGLKILQGFAFMIIVGVSVGVFITRPAFAAYLRIMMTTRKQRQVEDEEDEN